MKKQFRVVVLITLALVFQGQELRHATGVVNVEVPVRVFDGDTFIDSLALADFEVREDGVPRSRSISCS
jgi:hypothetical protein